MTSKERTMKKKNLAWKVEVVVTLKPSVLDPQGSTVLAALQGMGYDQLCDTRLGKYITLTFAGQLAQSNVEKQVEQMCRKLLANPVIERYRYHLRRETGVARA
jgi:phosphoribosylformylglycinamidine synthase subunit PurS